MKKKTMKIIKKVSPEGRDKIAEHEGGYILTAYLCPAKVWTISAGLTYYPNGKRVKEGDTINIEEARTMFASVLKDFETAVWSATRDDINQNQFDALVSFAFNVGVGAFVNSTLLKKVNKDPTDVKIMDEFLKWKYVGGKESRGLLNRRKRESNLYFSPIGNYEIIV